MIFIQNSNGKIIETDSEFLINLYNSQPDKYQVAKDMPLKKEKMEPVEVSKIDDKFIIEPVEEETIEEAEAIIEDVEIDEEIKTDKKKK